MKQHQEEVNKVLFSDPNSKGFFSTIGLVGGGGNSGFVFLHLKEPSERPEIPSATMMALEKKYGGVPVLGSILRSATPLFAHHPDITEVMQEMRMKLGRIPGILVFLLPVEEVRPYWGT